MIKDWLKYRDEKSRYWLLRLYQDSQQDVIDSIKEKYLYACILHDKDYLAGTKDFVKPHYHFVLVFDNGVYGRTLEKQLGDNFVDAIPINHSVLCEKVRYLCHLDCKCYNITKDNTCLKYRYDISDVDYSPTLSDLVNDYLTNGNLCEDFRVLDILKLLDSHKERVTYSSFVRECCTANLYGELRRMGYLITKIIEEHNEMYPCVMKEV